MESLNELLAQTSPICGGVLISHGNTSRHDSSNIETVPDLNLGLIDLGSINWDLCDFVATTTSTTTNGGSNVVVNHLENQSANLQENESANHYVEEEDRRAVVEDETRCFEGLDLLDFELNEEVLLALSDFENLHHTHSTMSPTTTNAVMTEEVRSPGQPQMLTDVSYMSQINSPSAEQTYSNLDSMSTAMNTMNTAISSPAESTTLYGVGDDSVMNYYSPSSSLSSIEDSPAPSSNKIRRTRARTIDKKESNKAAAIKYRNKKMKERESLFAECEEYAKRNAELKKKIDETQSEISFIKSLLVEALIAKSVPK